MPPSQKLTTHLLTLHSSTLKSATTHPFLAHAGTGKLPKTILAQWLSQDRLYAQTYVRFIGLLLSKVQLPTIPTAERKKESGECSIQEKIMRVLVDALVNIQVELGFYERTAEEYGLDLNTVTPGQEGQEEEEGAFGPNEVTRGYIDMFLSSAGEKRALLEGLTVLWATEECYLRAWRYAQSFQSQSQSQSPSSSSSGQDADADMDGGALRNKFIPNWASKEFEEFVVKIGCVLDEYAALELGGDLSEKGGLEKCEGWWGEVVGLEVGFWPDVEGVEV
ncbi:putative transcription regulator PAB1642 [Aspergillus stella-maris]|uniref:putative transcription regulator PAB1642 n=1 Tax=Aspergillus stella-maris TaxID=1810926 RepID=UPI003CCDD7F7